MTEDEARKLAGLYRIHWKSGGSSLAAIGVGPDGRQWLAPVNWLRPALQPDWDAVGRVEAVPVEYGLADALRLAAKVERLEKEQRHYAEHVATALALDERPMRWEEWVRHVRRD